MIINVILGIGRMMVLFNPGEGIIVSFIVTVKVEAETRLRVRKKVKIDKTIILFFM